MAENANSGPVEDTNHEELGLDALLNELEDSLASKRGRVVIYNDDHNNQTAVIAAVAGVVSHRQARVEEDDHPIVASKKVVDEATFLTLSAERAESAVVYEGDLATCDEIYYELTRGGADDEWFHQVSHVDPYLIPNLIMAGLAEGDLEMDNPQEALMGLVAEGRFEEAMLAYLSEILPRPVLTVEVIALDDEGGENSSES